MTKLTVDLGIADYLLSRVGSAEDYLSEREAKSVWVGLGGRSG